MTSRCLISSSTSSKMHRLHLPNRDHRLPMVYLVDDHPKVVDPKHGRIFVLLQDQTEKALKKQELAGWETEIPENKKQAKKKVRSLIKRLSEYKLFTLASEGLPVMVAHEYAFVRAKTAPTDGKEDILIMATVSPYV